MEWSNNPWIIGISTSIISGLLVYFITRKIFKEKQKREYSQKIRTANNEILYAIRPLIVEKTKPNIEIMDSVFFSTARKYGVNLKDLYDKETLCDDLINEIMSNSFLSSDQKMELTKMINELKGEKNEVQEKLITIYRDDKLSYPTYMAMSVSIMTGMIALVISLFIGFKDKDISVGGLDNFPQYFSILIIAMAIPLMAFAITKLFKLYKEKEKNRDHKKVESTKDEEEKTPTGYTAKR